ncbi:2-polyprenyl-6-methoxyphenol hydroxylase [Minicystis rosea]|nr:2-polyprenyl-6-methoxyphenol hydroxylase [Minicystis rosea]
MRVLIAGGGIGGFALARFLRQAGVACTVLERAPRFRALGHFIALKAEGVRVLDRLGVRDACAARALPSVVALRFATPAGHVLRRQRVAALDAALGGFLLLRRADLAEVLYQHVAGEVDVRFGAEVVGVTQEGGGVTATLADGRVERADVLVGADGVHSAVRRRLFGAAGELPLGGSYVALEVDCAHDAPVGEITAHLGRGQIVMVGALGPRRLVAVVYHGGADLRARLSTPALARDFFAREYAHFNPTVRALFAAIDADSFVFVDTITMVQLPSIVAGRVALLGDAAACPTFLSGMGSAYALLSAETLARALAGCAETDGEVEAALSAYAREAQGNAVEVHRSALRMRSLILGRSRLVTALRDSVLAAAPGDWLLESARRFYNARSGGDARAAAPS